ncbi:MAG: hypothetical protein PVI97_03280 [Candidatus Thiodiazotropha sp.]
MKIHHQLETIDPYRLALPLTSPMQASDLPNHRGRQQRLDNQVLD